MLPILLQHYLVMNIFEIYKKLKSNGDWVSPKQLKQTRTHLYRVTQVEFADLLGISYNTYKGFIGRTPKSGDLILKTTGDIRV